MAPHIEALTELHHPHEIATVVGYGEIVIYVNDIALITTDKGCKFRSTVDVARRLVGHRPNLYWSHVPRCGSYDTEVWTRVV